MANVLDTLRERGFLAQITFEEDLYKRFDNERMTYYVGFDPTADSLHIGHYIPIMAMAHLQRAGHRPLALMGGGTAMIGDPSGKTDMRKMLTVEDIAHNVAHIKTQMSRFLDFSGDAQIVNNADWLLNLNYVEFLREIGVHFSVNRMLTADCYKQRMEKGLTFLEFNYMLMQSYDFLELYRRYGCILQMGGDDQWSNILAGADLIRRKERKDAFALTFQLLLTHDGRKMGKTESGALWLDGDRVSPYDFYQYWRNVDDADVKKCLALLTFLPMEEVNRLGALRDSQINEAKTVLATEVTALVHGREAALEAKRAAEALFSGGGLAGAVPTTVINRDQLAQYGKVVDLMTFVGLTASKGEGRRLIQGGGVYVNGNQVPDADAQVSEEDFAGEGLMLRKGKKTYHNVVLK